MIQRFAVPVGAGAVSALLFALTVKGTPLALALAYLAPMPLMIAAFGWGALGGLAAAAIIGVSGTMIYLWRARRLREWPFVAAGRGDGT